MSDASPPTRYLDRLLGGLRRRWIYYLGRLRHGKRPTPVEAAVAWLLRPQYGGWLPRCAEQNFGCPQTTAAAIPIAQAYGLEHLAQSWSDWLHARLSSDTAGLPTQGGTAGLSTEGGTAGLSSSAMATVGHAHYDAGQSGGDACATVAAGSLSGSLSLQRPDGSVPARPDVAWVSSTHLARLAVAWYRHGLREPADRAMRCLSAHQNRSGAFPASWGPAAEEDPHSEQTQAVLYFLQAALLQVEAAFGPETPDVPDHIDPADGRVEAVRQWLRTLPGDACVADVGCGKGRYVRCLAVEFPNVRWIGIDVSAAMLSCLPAGVSACRGSLLRLPLADGVCDAALAVESLEHALLPQRALDEMCRIVRPGGRVLIIDKNQAKQRLSLHDPWERWFTPQELAHWLSRWCDAIRVRKIAHLEGRPGRNLFLAAEGTRR